VVLARGTKLEVLATNRLDESYSASPALAGGDLFLRGERHLYRIARAAREEKKPEAAAPPRAS
jgi:hypothetical protein